MAFLQGLRRAWHCGCGCGCDCLTTQLTYRWKMAEGEVRGDVVNQLTS
jgi:hypothetical protein